MPRACRIAVDLLGAETSTHDLLLGALEIDKTHPECELSLIGGRELTRNVDIGRHRLIHCTEWVNEDASLMHVLRQEVKPSMQIGLDLVRSEEVDGFVSLGNTGVLMALSRHTLRMQENVDRPAMIKEFRGHRTSVWMLDVGANLVRRAETLIQFAHLGSAFAEGVGGVSKPRVALLNIGVEEGKGTSLIKQVAQQLQALATINFCGFVEPNRLFDDVADVIVTDGFAGNIALKSIEGTAGFARSLIRAKLEAQGRNVTPQVREPMTELLLALDADRHNGASFVGLDGVVVKGHSNSSAVGMTAAIDQAIRQVGVNVPVRVKQHIRME